MGGGQPPAGAPIGIVIAAARPATYRPHAKQLATVGYADVGAGSGGSKKK
jgi:hypothetical protein